MALDAALESAPTPNRNNFSGSLGHRFVAARNLTVTALGRVVGSTFASSHKVILWTNAGVKLGEVTITTSSPRLNGWAYEMLASPVSLTNGTNYVIAVNETSGGDNWKNQSAVTGVDTSFIGGTLTSAFAATQNTFPTSIIGAGSYAWPNLYEGSATSIRNHAIRTGGNLSLSGIRSGGLL